PKAGSVEANAAVRERLGRQPNVTLRETTSRDHARELAAEAVHAGAGLVVAAGGDGSVNSVVSGLAENLDNARLAILPMGTGNDFARTLAMPPDPLEAVNVLLAPHPPMRRMDLVHVPRPDGDRHYINMATGGNTGHALESLSDEVKRAWGPLAYVRGAVDMLGDLTVFDVRMRFDDGPAEQYAALNVFLANGRTSGGGLPVAPRASPEDGLMDVIIIRDGTAIDLAALAARFFVSDYLESELIIYRRAQRVEIDAAPPLEFSADGDLIGPTPLTASVLPQALPVLVGPEYATEVR
ncbi:MAG: diacylglycerol/lipid kinase family protein, partial [Planctomycetaceae bacterium]